MAKDTNSIKEVAQMVTSGSLVTVEPGTVDAERMPPVLLGQATPSVVKRIERFYLSVAEVFELWVTRRDSPHTQRAYRQDVMPFVDALQISWPDDATALLRVSVADVLGYRDSLEDQAAAPKTINRRISSVSSFYKYLQGVAAELRLPIVVPNPAHSQFIARSSTEAREETKALTATKARQFMGLPAGDDPVAFRDRAIIKFFLYSGIRIATGCKLKVADLHFDESHEDNTVRINEKGNKTRSIGLHFSAAEAIREYMEEAEIARGPLFRPQKGSKTTELANRAMSTSAMHCLLVKYLRKLPGALKLREEDDPLKDSDPKRCVYSPHSLRATTATLLLDAGVDIKKVQELLGHKHVTTTEIYDKRRRSTKEGASHDVPI